MTINQFAVLPANEKLAYFEVAASKYGITSQLIEKDFWVCWILKQLFSMKPIGKYLTLSLIPYSNRFF
jgi:hypothetical protein